MMDDPEKTGFEFHVREVSGVVVIELMCALSQADKATPSLSNAVWEKVSKGRRLFLMNLASVINPSSTGIGLIVSAFVVVRNAGGELWFCEMQERMRAVLAVCILNPFRIFDSCEEALVKLLKRRP
jgi:anti-anti-sigma factor